MVEKGGVLMRLHARSEELVGTMVESARAAVVIRDTSPPERVLIIQ